MKSRILSVALAATAIATFACSSPPPGAGTGQTPPGQQPASNSAPGQPGQGAPGQAPKSFEPGSVQDMLSKQPDFRGDLVVTAGEQKIPGKIWKKAGRYRVDSPIPGVGQTVSYFQAGANTIIIIPEKKQYVEISGSEEQQSARNPLASISAILLAQPGIKFESAGEATVDGHPCAKYRVTMNSQEGELFLYLAKDLSNLLILAEQSLANQKFSVAVTNISTDVAEADLQSPQDLATAYTKITEEQMVKSAVAETDPTAAPSAPAKK